MWLFHTSVHLLLIKLPSIFAGGSLSENVKYLVGEQRDWLIRNAVKHSSDLRERKVLKTVPPDVNICTQTHRELCHNKQSSG